MAKYKITFKFSVPKDLLEIPNQDVAKILTRIDSLIENPRMHGGSKLTGRDLYRVRQGNYRVLYEIDDTQLEIIVIRIAHRASVYDF